MTPAEIWTIVSVGIAFSVAIAGGIVFLIREAKAAGRREGKLDLALISLSKITSTIETIPSLVVRMTTLENAYDNVRSDIKELRRTQRDGSWHGE